MLSEIFVELKRKKWSPPHPPHPPPGRDKSYRGVVVRGDSLLRVLSLVFLELPTIK